MGFDVLFEILGDYIDFFIDFFLLKGMDKYAKLGQIDANVVAYFVFGVTLAYVIARARRVPGFSRLQSVDDSQVNAAKVDDKPDILRFSLLSFIGVIVFHGFLLLYNNITNSAELGSVKDTLNAVFAYNSIYHPITALAYHLQKGAKAIAPAGCFFKTVALIILSGIALMHFGLLFYLLHSLSVVHGTSITVMLWPSLILIAVFFIIFWLFSRLAGFPFIKLFSSEDDIDDKNQDNGSE